MAPISGKRQTVAFVQNVVWSTCRVVDTNMSKELKTSLRQRIVGALIIAD
jgi:hypothetical protein